MRERLNTPNTQNRTKDTTEIASSNSTRRSRRNINGGRGRNTLDRYYMEIEISSVEINVLVMLVTDGTVLREVNSIKNPLGYVKELKPCFKEQQLTAKKGNLFSKI